jgi:clan AA aspartic protease (TIGR02281 family)
MKLPTYLACFALAFVLTGMLAAQEEKPAATPEVADTGGLTAAQAKAALEAAGFKVSVTGISLQAEADFAKQVRDILIVRKTFLNVEKELAATEAELDLLEAQMNALKGEEIKLNGALAAGGLNVENHNRLVGALNAIAGQLDLGLQQKGKANDKVKQARAKANESREAYIEKLLAVRTEADKVQQLWSKASTDAKNQAALNKVNEVLKKGITFKPTPVFTSAERQLASYEEKVLSENIKLRDDGDALWASVVINGKHTKEFVVSSGSAYIGIPFTMAKEMGLEPIGSDQEISLVMADGRELPGYLKKATSIRVGKFVVEDVEVVVLDQQAIAANPVLGMSFLGNFKFELDKARAALKMVKIDAEVQGAPKKDNNKK